VCVYIYAHTHTLCMGSLDVSPGVGTRRLESPKNLDGLNIRIHISVYVYKVHMCIYMLGGRMKSWIKRSFSLNIYFPRKRKAKNVNTTETSNPAGSKQTDSPLRVLDYFLK